VGIAETNEEAWLRHLAAHPEDFYANIRIFNRQKNVQEETGLAQQEPAKLEELQVKPGGEL
jgi:hypothetical protein